jgi:hypothetical protein
MRGWAVSITASALPGGVIPFIVDRHAHGNAGIVDDDIERAEMRGDVIHDLDDVLRFGDIENPCLCRPALGGNLVGHGLGGFGTEIGDGDVGALGGEHVRRGAAHAAGGAGDENGQAFDRAAELFEIRHDGTWTGGRVAGLTRLAPIRRQVKRSEVQT